MKQLITDIKELMSVVSGNANMAVTAKFSENGVSKFEAEELLRDKLKELYDPADFYADDSKKKACFALIAETVAQELPKRVEAQFGQFVEQKTVKVGDMPRFKYRLGKKGLRKFVTKGAQNGVYRKGTMDRGYIDFDYYTLGGAVRLEYREYISGFMTMAELQEVILDEATAQLYADIQRMLQDTFASLPAENKHTTNGFVETELDRIIATVSAYGDPVIFCTKRFANSIPTNLISDYDAKATNDMHSVGYVQDYKGTKIVILEQSFADESNTEKMVDDTYAYVFPTTKEAIIKVVFEGQMRISEQDVYATSAKEWKFEETIGMAMIYSNHVGIYRNVDLV